EAQLVAVAAFLPSVVAVGGGADASVVDERVEPLALPSDAFRKAAHLVERGEVGGVPLQVVVAGRGADVVDRLVAAGVFAAVDQHGRARRGKLGGDRAPVAVGGAGDQDRLLRQWTHERLLSGQGARRAYPGAG